MIVTGRFAVVTCSSCKKPWAIETRHDRVTCPRCGKSYGVGDRVLQWQGDDARGARVYIQAMNEEKARQAIREGRKP